jgi:glucosamine--fructose-6-phosphate aminotransferase (isomerizing)
MNEYSPLLDKDSPLDQHSRTLIEELSRRELEKSLTLPTDDPKDQKRRKRVEFTWDEMWVQPEKIITTLELEHSAIHNAANHLGNTPVDRVVMVGCGDSLSSMIATRSLYESLLGVPCEPIQALDFAYYYYLPITPGTLVIVLSSSGATTRVAEALMMAKVKGAKSLALSNTAGSPLMNEADLGVLIHAERKGWPTQSSTAAMAILYQFGIELARKLGSSRADETDRLEKTLHSTPAMIAETLQTHNESVAALAEEEADHALYLFAAGGPCYASAMIGAAKVKECSPSHAIAIPLEEYHHYNSQKIEEPLFLISPFGPSRLRALDTAREGKRVGGRVYSLISKGDETLKDTSDKQFVLPVMDERLAPMVYTVPLQLFAYHVAMAKFHLAEQKAN